jgi:nucleoside-triphosphatase
MKNLLLTGRPGVGKTTVIQRFVSLLPSSISVRGFYTDEIREGNIRQGFCVTALDGRRGILAHRGCRSNHRVGAYGVNIGDIEGIAVEAIKRGLKDADVVVIDEIGPMEAKSALFRDTILKALDSNVMVVATIKERGDRFISSIHARSDIKLIRVTSENRNQLPHHILELVKEGIHYNKPR